MIIAHPAPPVSAFSVRHHARAYKVPPVAAYVGGKYPHVTVTLYFDGVGDPALYRLRTPRGWVTVRWHDDSGTESGEPAPLNPEDDISHPDTICNIVIVSPPSLPVYFRGAGGAKWAHLNGNRVPSVQAQSGPYHYTHPADPFRMNGGLNIVAIGYPDAE